MWAYFIIPAIASMLGLAAMFKDYSHGNGNVDGAEVNGTV
jgi:hypothetical protein